MSHVRNRCRSPTVQELEDEPEPDEDPGWNWSYPNKNKGWHYADNFGPGKEYEVRPQDPRYGCRSTDSRDEGIVSPIHNSYTRVSESTSDSKDEVEEEVLDVPKSVLNVVSKDEKENHVPEDVPEVTMKKH
ncbi:unnamed protein product [marine sediment metagenome]|uniref:Uncharacterized protein n=1 Tax=marine sediment metagenome TaxID=412755 RepID=X1FZS2_9ZZZZ